MHRKCGSAKGREQGGEREQLRSEGMGHQVNGWSPNDGDSNLSRWTQQLREDPPLRDVLPLRITKEHRLPRQNAKAHKVYSSVASDETGLNHPYRRRRHRRRTLWTRGDSSPRQSEVQDLVVHGRPRAAFTDTAVLARQDGSRCSMPGHVKRRKPHLQQHFYTTTGNAFMLGGPQTGRHERGTGRENSSSWARDLPLGRQFRLVPGRYWRGSSAPSSANKKRRTASCETIEGTRQTGAVYSRRGLFQQQAKEQCSEVGETSRLCLNHLDESDGRRGRGLQCGPQPPLELLRCEPCAPRRHEAPVLTITRFEGWGGRTGQAQGRHRKREGTHRRERRDKTTFTFQRARRATSARAG